MLKGNFPTIPKLIKSFMDVEYVLSISDFIKEVPNFKGFIQDSIMEGEEALDGHTKAQQFKFYLDTIGCSAIKYKLFGIDID